jgi:hypothetical protein
MTRCPERRALERFAAGSASRDECQLVVRHLLARCGRCAAGLRSVFRPVIEDGYDLALFRFAETFQWRMDLPEEVASRAMKSIGSL